MKKILTAAVTISIFFTACKKSESNNTSDLSASLDGSYKMISNVKYSEDTVYYINGDLKTSKIYDTVTQSVNAFTIQNSLVKQNNFAFKSDETYISKFYAKATNTYTVDTIRYPGIALQDNQSAAFIVKSTDSVFIDVPGYILNTDGNYKNKTFKYTLAGNSLTLTGAYSGTGAITNPPPTVSYHNIKIVVSAVYQKQ